MSERNTKRASLAAVRRMKQQGKLFHDPNAAEGGEDLDAHFWRNAKIEGPTRPRSVHLKIDQDVFDYFYSITNGKGHLTRMQNVLRAYVKAHKQS